MLTKVTTLSSKCTLVKLTIRRPRMVVPERGITAAVQQQFNDTSLAVSSKIFRQKGSPIHRIMTATNEAYAYHKERTLPYVDAGPRMLPNTNYFEYTQEMRHKIAVVDKLLATYMPMYDQLVRDDILFRNGGQSSGRAHVDDYPTATSFQASMSLDLRFQPMPDSRHFLFDLSDDDLKGFEAAEAELEQLAVAETVQRMLKPLVALVARLDEYQGQKGERWHNSIVENVLDGIAQARRIAVNATPELIAEMDSLEALTKRYLGAVEIIKASPSARASARAQLDAASQKLSAYF